MTVIIAILAALGQTYTLGKGAFAVTHWVTGFLRTRMRESRTADVMTALRDLGVMSEADVRRMVAAWEPERPVDDDARSELTAVLVNLVRGARFHTTQGTPLSSYLRCERLIEQLLANLQPRRRKGEPVGPGRKDWTLDAFVGMGSFGEVWLARAAHYPEPRAFKFFTTEGAREWLQRESAALYEVQRQLSAHDNVIRYIDIDSDGEPYPYLVLEYVGGSSLEDWVLSPPGDRAAATAPDLMAGIARGLAAAHRYGICHRDLKPANVLLTGGPIPVAKIADFGLARVEAERPEGSTLLTSGAALVGTRLYLPPEAADPYVSRSAAQDDVFAFGVIWFQVLTGRIERPPYDFADILHQTGSDSRTVRLVSRCLARQDRRFATAGELLEAMEADPPAETWTVPPDCFDVGAIAAEYLAAQSR